MEILLTKEMLIDFLSLTFLAHSCACMQAMNEYCGGPNVDGSFWMEVCGRKFVDKSLWMEVKICSPPLLTSANKAQISFDFIATSKCKE